MVDAVILDIDGTLVDTNYQHALAWFRAFKKHGIVLSTWRIHRHVGMGGDQLIAALCDDEVEQDKGDDIRAAEKEEYSKLIDEVEPLQDAHALIEDLTKRGLAVVLASSAKEEEVEHYLDLLDCRDLIDGWTTSADVERTKPHPDLVEAALEKAGTRAGLMVGDSTYDCEAASRAGIPTAAVLTGGFSESELTEAGAVAVFESLPALRQGFQELLGKVGQKS